MDNEFPINRIVAFAGPYVAIVSGALADWLIVHVHILGLFHTSQTAISGAVTQIIVFGITALLVWAGHQKWLSGWQSWERTVAGAMANGPNFPPPVGEYDPATLEDEPEFEEEGPSPPLEPAA
jgi:hypothetical protein